MSLSGARQEMQTVIARVAPAAGATETVQIDAEEDREILGFLITSAGIGPDETVSLLGSMFIGSDPDVATNNVEDLGGKFAVEFGYSQNDDSTNGVGLAQDSNIDSAFLPEGAGWDWNEDATLTCEVTENRGTDSGGMNFHVYYREV